MEIFIELSFGGRKVDPRMQKFSACLNKFYEFRSVCGAKPTKGNASSFIQELLSILIDHV